MAQSTVCEFSACDKRPIARNLCGGHYRQMSLGRPMVPLRDRATKPPVPCRFDGCERDARGLGLCSAHHQQHAAGKPLKPLRVTVGPGAVCGFKGCGGTARASGYCTPHQRQIRERGYATEIRSIRPRGSGWVSGEGYRYLKRPDHPNAMTNGYVAEHTLVVSERLGRGLVENENVHHINGVRDDNRPENLEIWSSSQPSGQRIEDKVSWAKELLALYEPEALA